MTFIGTFVFCMKFITIVLFFLAFISQPLNAQQVFFTQWNVRHGMPSDVIYDLGKDSGSLLSDIIYKSRMRILKQLF